MTSFNINGIVVETSDRGTTGYLGATFSPDWREETPFIAAVSNPTDPVLMGLFRRPDSTSLHLGDYDDARKAAYVTAYYKSHPEDALKNIEQNVSLDIDFPPELFDLPVYYSLSDAQSAIRTAKANKKAGIKSSRTRFKVDIQATLAAFHKANGSAYKATGADATAIRATMQAHLDTIATPNQADVDEAARLGFEPYKR